MSIRPVSLRFLTALLTGLLLALPAGAQDVTPRVTANDLRRALIWTGHYSYMNAGEPADLFRAGSQSWQASKKYKVTDSLSGEQQAELLAEGEKQRDAFGWATFEDKSVGFAVGVPTKLVKFLSSHTNNGGLTYEFEGSVWYSINVRYGDLSCINIDQQLVMAQRLARPTFKVRHADGYAVGIDNASMLSYLRAVCRTSGVIMASVDIPRANADKFGVVISAMAESLTVSRQFNPTAIPRPKLDQPTPTADDIVSASATSTRPASKPAADVDSDGKTAAVKRETREGKSLTPEQVFDKVSPAVFVVVAGDRMGSAVAISDHELLTNCHVVKEVAQVTLMRDKAKQSADVISVNEKADRCILRTTNKLDKWVSVRPYDDIKAGERALTVGTPQGLELTVADGLVSSKRTHEGRRLIQTTAPISQGSSGGGLFDAEGHLLGITTFHLKVGQNLNFAIAAEDFAK